MEAMTLAVTNGMPANPLKPQPGAHTWLARLSRNLTRYPQRETIRNVDELKPGDPIEFGADILPQQTSDGKRTFRQPRRWCGVVLEVSPDALVVLPSFDDFAALRDAYQWRQANIARPKEGWEDGYDEAAGEPAA